MGNRRVSEASERWNDPNSPWTKKMIRQRRMFSMSLVPLILLDCFMVWIMISIMRRPVDFLSVYLIGMMLFIIVMPLVVLKRQLSKNRRVMERLPSSSGRLCPICIEELNRGEDGTLTCAQCGRFTDSIALEEYWENYAMDSGAAVVWRSAYKAQGARGWSRWHATLKRKFAENPLYAIFWMVGVFAVGGVVFSWFNSESLIAGVFRFLHMMFLMGGMFLIGFGQMKRKGRAARCSACEYRCPPQGDLPAVCPECGADWNRAGGLVKGERIRTKEHMIAGVVCIVIGAGIMFNPFFGTSWKYTFLPTNSLIKEAVKIWYRDDVWIELGTRTLSTEQHDTLVRGLLDMRLSEGSASNGGGAWLDTQVTANALTTELLARYYEESFRLDLDGPTTARLRESISISMTSETRTIKTLAGLDLFVFLGDYFVNGRRIKDSRFKRVTYVSIVNSRETSLSWIVVGTDDFTITREVWVAINPTSLQGQIQWQADGTPVIPTGVTWSRKITLEHVIEVVE